MRRLFAVAMLFGAFFCLVPMRASAHPLGNFTINHFARVTVDSDAIDILFVLDLAEIPAFTERQAIDADGDDEVSAVESARYLDLAVPALVDRLALTLDGRPASLTVRDRRLTFPPGQAALPTMRLELDLHADLPRALSPDRELSGRFADETYPERIGWREVVVTSAAGAELAAVSVPGETSSDELRAYPDPSRTEALHVRDATFTVRAGTGAVAAQTSAASNDPLPGDPLSALLRQGVTSIGSALLAVLLSIGLGAAHALSPGHGKTLVAAALIGGGGGMRHAVWLGVTVAVTHTAGVFVLGLVVLGASELIVPDRVVAWLALASGVIVVGMGLWLALGALRARRETSRHAHQHVDGHAHSHAHHHAGADEHEAPDHNPPIKARSVALIGLAGGLVPSASALIVLLVAVSEGQLLLGAVLIAAFGVGMALVLGGLGVGVAAARSRIRRRGSQLGHPLVRRLATAVPVLAALVVVVIGIALTIEAAGRIG